MICMKFVSLDSSRCLLSKYMIITYIINNVILSYGLENLRNDLFGDCELPPQGRRWRDCCILLVPDGTVCISMPCTTLSGEDSWEIVAVSSNLQLKGTLWASGNIRDNPIRSLSFGPSSTWDIRVSLRMPIWML